MQRDLHNDFACVLRARMRPIGAFSAKDLDVDIAQPGKAFPLEEVLGAPNEAAPETIRLPRGVAPADEHQAGDLVAIHDLRAGFQCRRSWPTQGSLHLDAVRSHLSELDVSPIAGHVGQQIPGRIAYLVDQLLGGGANIDQTSGAIGLGEHERAIRTALGHRVSEVVPGRHVLPVGQQAPRRLRPAFE